MGISEDERAWLDWAAALEEEHGGPPTIGPRRFLRWLNAARKVAEAPTPSPLDGLPEDPKGSCS